MMCVFMLLLGMFVGVLVMSLMFMARDQNTYSQEDDNDAA